MVIDAGLSTKLEVCEATTNNRFETLQNAINAVLEELRHLHAAQVCQPIQNVEVHRLPIVDTLKIMLEILPRG